MDLNVDGVFDNNTELVANGLSPAGSASYTATFAINSSVSNLNTRMRVLVVANTNAPSPCGVNILNAEVEDYQVRVQPLAARDAQALPGLTVFPNPTADGLLRLNLAEASAAGTYAVAVQNLLGATVLNTSLRLSPTADAQLDLSRLAPGVYVLHLRDAQGQTAVRRVVRQ
ncbi:T9SS type A sorting domain-containing protein [Hymenobacter sp. 5317J-9]|nr:T9SS type A sorting domain-containing protein [Hymenobacter sp. 5317J-9]